MILKNILSFSSFLIPISVYLMKPDYAIMANPLPEIAFAAIYLSDLVYYKNYDKLKILLGVATLLHIFVSFFLGLKRIFYLFMIIFLFASLLLYVFSYVDNMARFQTRMSQKYILPIPFLTIIQLITIGSLWIKINNEDSTTKIIIIFVFFLIAALNTFSWLRRGGTNMTSFLYGILGSATLFLCFVFLIFKYDEKQDQDYKMVKFLYLLVQIIIGLSGMHHMYIPKLKIH